MFGIDPKTFRLVCVVLGVAALGLAGFMRMKGSPEAAEIGIAGGLLLGYAKTAPGDSPKGE